MVELSRRAMFKAAGAVGAAILPAADVSAATPAIAPPAVTYLFLNAVEAAFIEAAVARLIPTDARWPGAIEAGVPNYIDKQLAGAWGAGERLYRGGPWQPGIPGQGYQLPFTPAELFRTALGAIDRDFSRSSTPFVQMTAERQDAYLHELEAGGKDLGGVPGDVFFEHLWNSTVEGFFSDPVYGGNRDMVAWRMIGFPGAYASYYALVDKHGIKIDRPPMSLAQDSHGHMHMDPEIPAHLP
jgi:gluconate 2-dehydrogenase gamma chain